MAYKDKTAPEGPNEWADQNNERIIKRKTGESR